jgi:mannose-1-phosphate guanylyltransferase
MLEQTYAVIMAGGKGERFWPLSTAARPKQFLTLIGGKPLLQLAVERLAGLIPPARVLVITRADLVAATIEAAPELPRENVIGEPFGRDTAAACALAWALVKARTPSGVIYIGRPHHGGRVRQRDRGPVRER